MGERLDRERVADVVAPGAPPPLINRDAEQAEARGGTHQVRGKRVLLVDLGGAGSHLGPGERLHLVAKRALVGREVEDHAPTVADSRRAAVTAT